MSSETFNMSADQPPRGLNLGPSPRSPYSKSSRSPSPYSSSSNSNLGDREGNSYPDINVLDYCVSEGSPVDTYNTTLPQGDLISPVSMNLNQTFIATPVDGSIHFWNENLSFMHDQETWLAKYPTFKNNTTDGSKSLVMSPDSSGRESQLSSCEISRRGSLENGNYSLSSGEMVVRSNSFCLEDQSILVVSSLDETSISPAVGHPALPVGSNLLSTTLPDVCEKPTEKLAEEDLGHPFLGMTFIQTENWEFPIEENEKTSSLATLPSENEMGLLKTFVCETSSEDSGKEAKFPSEADLLHHFPQAITPEQGKTFVSTAMQETNNDIHTSTPLQIIGNKIPSLPSFSESPFTGNLSSPGLNPVKQPVSLTPKGHVVAGLEVLQVNRTPNLDLSGKEYKVLTGTGPQMTVPSPVTQFKRSQLSLNNKHTDIKKGFAMRISPTKVSNTPALDTLTNKMVSSTQSQLHKVFGNVDMTNIQLSGHPTVELDDQKPSPMNRHPASNTRNLAVKCCDTRSEVAKDASETHAGNQTFCYTSLEKFPDTSVQTNFKPALKEGMSEKIEVKSRSALGQHKPPVLKTRLRFSSDSSSSRSTKEKRIIPSFTVPKGDIHPSQTRAGNLSSSSQNKKSIQTEASSRQTKNSSRDVKKISLVTESSKSTSGALWNDSKSKLRGGSSPRRKRETPLSQSLAANPRPATLSTRLKQGILGRDDCKVSRAIGTPQSKLKNTTGSQRVQATGEPTFRNGSAAITKHQLNGSQPPQTPTRTSFMGPPPTPSSKIPRKTPRLLRTPAEAGAHREMSEITKSSQVSSGTANNQTPLKSVFKARNISTPGKSTQPTLTSACKPVASTSKQVSSTTVSPLLRTASAKFVHPPLCVDKIKSKASSCQQRHQQQATQSNQSNGPPDVVPASVAEVERKNHKIQQLKGLLTTNNCRFEAITIVLQQTLAKSDEVTRQCRELSQELVNLRGELVCSERLEKEKEELRVTLEDALKKLQEQHQKDLTELEQSLQAFYQEEWDKVHLTYQNEADKCKTLMQHQMGELISSHEAMKLELQTRHAEQLQSVKQQCEMSLEELRKAHSAELQSMENSLKHTEASLSGKIQELTVENNALIEKLTADENMWKESAEKSQKDSHTLYLEQELESLKVVLDIKNKRLHQQEKKLVELDKLTEKNVKLDESLKKVQQENEDLKARMERHAALSRQLSTEQAVLQESLQKESKVNKRLSMENEELLWKLHNGDLSSPRKVSPTSTSPLHSPSHSFNLQSPHSPNVFSSSPLSPR